MSDNLIQAVDAIVASITGSLDALNERLLGLQQAVYSLRNTIASNPCGCPVGVGPDNEGGDGETIPGQTGGGQEFIPAVIVDQDKCDRADYIWNSVYDTLFWLDENNVIALTGGSLSAVIGFLAGFLAVSGPFGAILVGVAGLIVALSILIITVTLDTFDMVSEWQAAQEDLMCCMYNAQNTDGARSCIQAVLEATPLASGEIDFIMLFLPNAVLSLLFADTDESAIFFDGYEATFDCAPCAQLDPTEWVFLPSGALFGQQYEGGFAGTGTILNDGNQFTISSVERTDNPGVHEIGIVVRGFLLVQSGTGWNVNPCGAKGGTTTRHSPLPSSVFGRSANSDCTVNLQGPVGGSPPAQQSNLMLYNFGQSTPFSMTFSINVPPTAC